LLRTGAIALVSLPLGCGKGGAEAAAAPPAPQVQVPAAPAGTDGVPPAETLPARRPAPADDTDSAEVEVAAESDSVHFSSHSDGGVRFWGTFTSRDDGFSFKGGFSAGTSAGGAVDGGASP
jgi:hypothetical protein